MTILQQDAPLQSHEVSQLYAIFTALPTGVLLLDGEGLITRANPAAWRCWESHWKASPGAR